MAYRQDRYLANATLEEVRERFLDLTFSQLTLSSDGLVGPHVERYKEFFGSRSTHLMEEASLRGLPISSVFARPKIDNFLSRVPFAEIEAGLWFNHPTKAELLRFGQFDHIADILNHGRIRICPATYYQNATLNSAVADDELNFTIIAASRHPITKQIIEKTCVLKERSDYYLLCFTKLFDHRLPFDFERDTVILIHDKAEFQKRVTTKIKSHLGDRFKILGSDVTYIDPYLETKHFKSLRRSDGSVQIWRAKHFKFMYQNEYRIVALPDSPTSHLGEPFFIEIGNLTDIAEMHLLKNS